SASVRVEHGFQILKMAGSCARHGFRQHLRRVTVCGCAKLAEGGKEMVMAGFSAGDKLAHGKRVQQMPVKGRVLEGYAGKGLSRCGVAWRLRQRKRVAVDTQSILGRILNEAFRIDRA